MTETEIKMRAALKQLVDLYVKNQGTKHEFIACITPKSASRMSFQERRQSKVWRAFDDARELLENSDHE